LGFIYFNFLKTTIGIAINVKSIAIGGIGAFTVVLATVFGLSFTINLAVQVGTSKPEVVESPNFNYISVLILPDNFWKIILQIRQDTKMEAVDERIYRRI